MAKEVIFREKFDDLESFLAIIDAVKDEARLRSKGLDELQCSHNVVSLVEETLTDGSKVLNVHFFDDV